MPILASLAWHRHINQIDNTDADEWCYGMSAVSVDCRCHSSQQVDDSAPHQPRWFWWRLLRETSRLVGSGIQETSCHFHQARREVNLHHCHHYWYSSVSRHLSWDAQQTISTRGHDYKLLNKSFHYDIRKYSFSCRVVNVWNSLPQHVVEASNTNIFKTRLDKFWSDQDCKYLWKANLSGTGSRSEVLCNYDDP